MSRITLTRTSLTQGVWQAVLTVHDKQDAKPEISVTHLDKPLDGVTVTDDRDTQGEWSLRVPIPAETISDGVQTYLVKDAGSGEKLASFAILAGDALDDDIRAEIDLLRAELDMLKRAFRRHCLETM